MFYLGALLRTIAWETASQTTLRDCSKEVREALDIIGAFAGEENVVGHQKITTNHKKKQKNGHLKLMTLVLFSVWEDARAWAH